MNRKWAAAALAVLMVLLGLVCAAAAETVVGDPLARLNAGQIEIDGEMYRPKRRLVSVLMLGTDRYAQDVSQTDYRSGVQADFLLLLAIDDNAQTITPIQINRDTMMDIRTFSVFGSETGMWNAQICLSYSFGDAKEQSCALTAEAVSRLLSGVAVDYTLSVSLDAIAALNDALGGVTVTLEDDFTAYDPAMTAGTTLTLAGKQAEYYLRMRYGVGDSSNQLRLDRQRNYLSSAASILRSRIGGDKQFIDRLFADIEPYLVTDMTRGFMINLGNRASQYEIKPIEQIEGETVLGDSGYMEFYPDQDALERLVLSAFYDKVE